MEKYLIVLESNCKDSAREKEFNEWYDQIHIPDIFETPCYVKASRYELTQPAEGKGKYIAVYEIESDDIDADMEKHMANMKNKQAQGRMSDLIAVVSRAVYKEISSHSRP